MLDRVVAEAAATAAEAARAGDDPVASLRAGCDAWLELALDPSVQRIVLLDPPAVVGGRAGASSTSTTRSAACA